MQKMDFANFVETNSDKDNGTNLSSIYHLIPRVTMSTSARMITLTHIIQIRHDIGTNGASALSDQRF